LPTPYSPAGVFSVFGAHNLNVVHDFISCCITWPEFGYRNRPVAGACGWQRFSMFSFGVVEGNPLGAEECSRQFGTLLGVNETHLDFFSSVSDTSARSGYAWHSGGETSSS
jgi:hypothetical protein